MGGTGDVEKAGCRCSVQARRQRASGGPVAILFSGTVDRSRRSLFFWGFPMASLSLRLWFWLLRHRSVGFVGGARAKATAHLSGVVLLSADPSSKVMLPLIGFGCAQCVEIHVFGSLFFNLDAPSSRK